MLTEKQPAYVLTLKARVEVPVQSSSLNDGIQEKLFMKKKIVSELYNSYQKRLKALEISRMGAIEQAEKNLDRVYASEFMGIPNRRRLMSYEKVFSLLSSVIDICIEPTVLNLSLKLQRQQAYMEYRLQKIECLSILHEDM